MNFMLGMASSHSADMAGTMRMAALFGGALVIQPSRLSLQTNLAA
jgi:hypothetical protein